MNGGFSMWHSNSECSAFGSFSWVNLPETSCTPKLILAQKLQQLGEEYGIGVLSC